MRTVRTFAGLAVAGVIALLAVLFVGAYAAKTVAQGNLEDSFKDEQAALEARDAKVSVYDQYVAEETRELTLVQIGWAEIDYAALEASVMAQANADASFTALNFYGPSADGAGGGAIDPLWGGGVGRMDFTAQTRTYAEAIALVGRLEALPGIAKVVATEQVYESEAPTVTWEVKGTGVITSTALTRRLLPVDGVIDPRLIELILGGVGVPAPEPSVAPSAEPSAQPSAEPTATASAGSEG
ncbi:MAG: hypothetical protein HGA51_00055 [Demequinaceae bacterium]|nr:hypothetical protein [Demequinaceae bacterium]